MNSLLNQSSIIGIDTEFDWRNTYFPVLSLIQISLPDKIFLVDCLKCKNLSFLKKILENKNILKIFHSVRSDSTILYSSLNVKMQNIFDIQLAEKEILQEGIKSYALIVKNYFEINLPKSETNSNWLKRPLSDNQLRYASDDVNYLIDIYKKQSKILKSKNVLEKSSSLSNKECSLGSEKLISMRLKKLKNINSHASKIFIWREERASQRKYSSILYIQK